MTGVPSFPDFRNIALADKGLFESIPSKLSQETAELTFTNLYIWRNCIRSQITSINGNVCVVARPDNELPYFFEPLGSYGIEETIRICLSHVPMFRGASEKFTKAHFEGKSGYRIEPARNDFDYLYRAEDLIALKGKKYDGKRNIIKRFLKNNIPIYQKLTVDMVPDCLKLLDKWGKNKATGVCFDEPIREALNNLSSLSVEGAAVKINGKIEAFTIGEMLDPDTAVVYIEVANLEIDGLSQYINQQFIKNEWAHFNYINREQDMGDAGLRRAKLSYHPCKLVNKYDITLVV